MSSGVREPREDAHVIQLPSALKLHNVGSLLREAVLFPLSPKALHLSFHPKYNQFEPFGIAMLAAWADHWRARGVEIRCSNVQAKGIAYARRLGLFDFLPGGPTDGLVDHEGAGRFVALRKIQKQQELTALVAEMGAILRSPELIASAQYTVAEMCRNVLEHAGAPAFVCVQTYPKAKRVSIGIADCGRGVLESLRRNYNFETDAGAIVGAAKPGVSGASSSPYGSPDNAGLGLFYARGLARLSSQFFLLGSGSAVYRLARSRPGAPPARNPTEERHDLYDGLPGWKGTLVAVDLGQSGSSHADFIRSIAAVAGPDEPMREAKRKIRFT